MVYGVILYVWVKKTFWPPPTWPLLGPIFLYFWGILAHTLGFATGVILIVYVLVYVFLRSFKHFPGGIFSLIQNIQFWAGIIYHLKCIVNGNEKLDESNIVAALTPYSTPFYLPFDPLTLRNQVFLTLVMLYTVGCLLQSRLQKYLWFYHFWPLMTPLWPLLTPSLTLLGGKIKFL